MTEIIEITGIRKDNGNHENPFEAVEAYRWVNHLTGESGIAPRHTAVTWVENGNLAYVQRVEPRAYCYVNTSRAGTKFLQTRADATEANNLLKLPEV